MVDLPDNLSDMRSEMAVSRISMTQSLSGQSFRGNDRRESLCGACEEPMFLSA
jgi:hypothetical protein